MLKINYKSIGLTLLACLTILLGTSLHTFAADRTYILSYSPGTLFHQLVRDRIKKVYERAGLEVECIALPHNRSLVSANEGTVDGDVGRVPSVEEKYPNLLRVNVKLMDLNGAVYTARTDIGQYSADLLKTRKTAYVLGVRWPEKKMEGLKAVKVRDYHSLFEMLLQNRVDIALATEASARSTIEKLGQRAERIHRLDPLVLTAPIYHYLNKKNAGIIPLLEKTLEEMNSEGE
ncbi:MAG: hypothetical protein MI863_22935 [Desulfobacterales bacterium]|nr:hypothetical protein [Desulfobacterales bacterium]